MLDHWGVWSAMKSQNTRRQKQRQGERKWRENPAESSCLYGSKISKTQTVFKPFYVKAGVRSLPMLPMNQWILGFWQVPVISVGMQSTQKYWEMLRLFWNKAWFQYDLPKSRCSGIKYGLKMWSGDLFKLKMCSGDRKNVLRRLFPSLKLTQKSPDIRTTVSQNMHQY